MTYQEEEIMEVSRISPVESERLLVTSPDALEKIEALLFDWQCLPGSPTAEEIRPVHLETLDELLFLAGSTTFSGAVVLAFEHGHLSIMQARTALQTFEELPGNSLRIKL